MNMMKLDHDLQNALDDKRISHYEAWRFQTGRDTWAKVQKDYVGMLKERWDTLSHDDRCRFIVTAFINGKPSIGLITKDRAMLNFVSEHRDELLEVRKKMEGRA